MSKDEALKMAYKAEKTGNLQDLVDAVNALMEALEQPAQEPYGWYDNHDIHTKKQSNESIALYTHPHQWQGLTDDEKLASIRKWSENNTMRGIELIGLCDAIEQALKDKNVIS